MTEPVIFLLTLQCLEPLVNVRSSRLQASNHTICVYIYIYIHSCMCVYVNIYIYIFIYIYIYICVSIYICIYVRVYVLPKLLNQSPCELVAGPRITLPPAFRRTAV